MGKAVDTLSAGQEKAYPIGGNYLNVVKSAQLLEVELVSGSDSYESHHVKQGSSLLNKKFASVVVRNEGEVPVDIILVSGVGEYQPSQSDSTVKIDTTDSSVPVTLDESQLNLQVNQQTAGATNSGLAKVTLATGETKKLCDVSATRKYVKYNILSSSDCEYIHIGGSGVDANTGYALERGMVAADETTGELWAHNPNAEAAVVFVMDVAD